MLNQETLMAIEKIVNEGINILESGSTASTSYADDRISVIINGVNSSFHVEANRSEFADISHVLARAVGKAKRTYIFLKGSK